MASYKRTNALRCSLRATGRHVSPAFSALRSRLRWVEAYGLWYGRRWAQQFAAASGAIYLPFEAFELATTHSGLAAAALLLNAAIVVLMLRELRRRSAG